MTQPGHNIDIYDDRYVGQTKNTAFAEDEDRGRDNVYEVEQAEFGSSSGTLRILAPFSGKLSRVELVSASTTTAINTVELDITNESNSAAAMVTDALYDAAPVATADTVVAPVLSTTAANLAVTQGDNLEIAVTIGGTISGGVVSLFFEQGEY